MAAAHIETKKMAQDAVEAQEDRRLDPAPADLADQVEEVDLALLAGRAPVGTDDQATLGIDAEVAAAPLGDVVEGFGVEMGPVAHSMRGLRERACP